MKIFELLNNCEPDKIKVHFATENNADPLELFKADQQLFTNYQNIQTKRNFSRPFILSLIQLDNKTEWLFAGIYEVSGTPDAVDGVFHYQTKLTDLYQSLIGRLIFSYKKPFRNSYPNAETISDVTVLSIKEERLSVSDFISFHDTNLSRLELETIYKHEAKDWKAALSSIAAIYLITDKISNKLYVGSAYKTKMDGEGSLWNRWKSYALSYHGGNKLLVKHFQQEGIDGFKHFKYSILETFDVDVSPSDIISREVEWKNRLRSIETGFNDN